MQINNREIHIEQHGDPIDPTIILLHHGLGSTQAWQGQIQALTKGGYHLILYDRWGYGKSESRPYLAVPDFKDDLADLHEIISIYKPDPLVLLGHSDGGSVALYYAAKNPGNLDALIIVAAHIYLEPKMEPGIQAIQSAFEYDKGFRKGMRRIHGEKFESTFYNWYNGWHTPKTLNWDMRPSLTKIKCPVFVIQGEEDEHATSQHAEDIADNISSSELWLVPGARHMLPQEIPDKFNQEVLKYLERVKKQ